MVNVTEQQQKRGSLIAGIGALVSVGAFLLLPYFNITVTETPTYGGYSTTAYSQTFSVGTGFITLFTGIIWLEALLAVAIAVVAALVMWREAPFGHSKIPVATQMRRAAYTMLIVGAIGILFQFLFTSAGSSQVNDMLQSTPASSATGSISAGQILALLTRSGISVSVAIGYGIGSWLYLLGLCGAIVGGLLMLGVGTARSALPQSPRSQALPPSEPQPQPWYQTGELSQRQSSQSLPQGWQQPPQPLPQGWQQPPQPLPQGWQQPSQPLPQGWQQPSQNLQQPPSQNLQQGWQQPPQEVRRPPTQDWQGWQQPPASPLQ